jgi:hypothetical protein
VSAVVDLAAGWYSDGNVTAKSGADPADGGFNLQRLELGFEASPHEVLRGAVYVVLPNLKGIDVDEGFLEAKWARTGLQLKAGVFRAAFGRENTQHLHELNFTRRAVTSITFLGIDSLRAPGMEVAWKVPRLRVPLWFRFAALSVTPAPVDEPLQSFGGGARYDFAYVFSARTALPIGPRSSAHLGLSWARGKTSQTTSMSGPLVSTVHPPGAVSYSIYDNYYDYLYGADLYFHFRPKSAPSTTSISWQTELVIRHIPNLVVTGIPHRQVEGGLYSELVVQAVRIVYVGARFEMLGLPYGDNVRREYAGALSVTVVPWSFLKLRVHGEVRAPEATGVNGAAFVQIEGALGTHALHDHGGGR